MGSQAVVTIGTFDGVHLGHRRVLSEVTRQAEESGADAVAYAFRRPPRRELLGAPGRFLLLPEATKVRLLQQTVDRVVRARFADVRKLSPPRFAKDLLVDRLGAVAVVVGPSFRFGARRAGDLDTLRRLGTRHGFTVTVVPPVTIGGESVNSTRIRALVEAGEIAGATALLGRPPLLVGEVTHGDRVGRTLGYPTANLAIGKAILLPGDGVYAAYAFVADDPTPRPALLYLGTRPTIAALAPEPRCEVHLLSASDEDLYERRIEVQLIERLRTDRAFPSFGALRRQIARDAVEGEAILRRPLDDLAPIAG